MVLVHNHVVPPAKRSGTRGFRFWLQPPPPVLCATVGGGRSWGGTSPFPLRPGTKWLERVSHLR
jgi:hypothetical protein